MRTLKVECRLLYEDLSRRTVEFDPQDKIAGEVLFDIANQLKRRGKLEIRSRFGSGKFTIDQNLKKIRKR